MDRKIIIFGAGGHCRTVLSLLDNYDFKIMGIADRTHEFFGECIGPFKIKNTWDSAEELFMKTASFAALAIGNNKERSILYSKLLNIGYQIPALVHDKSIIDTTAKIGLGTQVCLGAMIGPYVSIGDNSIIYTGSIIDHETQIGNNVFIAPGCNIAGRVNIGDSAFIGIGATIREKISIGKNAVVGAGTVVISDVPSNTTVVGVPAYVKE